MEKWKAELCRNVSTVLVTSHLWAITLTPPRILNSAADPPVPANAGTCKKCSFDSPHLQLIGCVVETGQLTWNKSLQWVLSVYCRAMWPPSEPAWQWLREVGGSDGLITAYCSSTFKQPRRYGANRAVKQHQSNPNPLLCWEWVWRLQNLIDISYFNSETVSAFYLLRWKSAGKEMSKREKKRQPL